MKTRVLLRQYASLRSSSVMWRAYQRPKCARCMKVSMALKPKWTDASMLIWFCWGPTT